VLPVVGAAILVAMVLSLRFGKGHLDCHNQNDWSLLSWFVMPIFLGLVVAPAGLGAFVASSRQADLLSGNTGNSTISLDLGAGSGYKSVTVAELAEAGHIKVGKVSVEGQILGSVPGLKANECPLAHYVMVCCAADLHTVAVILRYPSNYHPKKDRWVRVYGTVRRDSRGVVLDGKVIQPIAEPNPPYLY
jgi:hypothetical protein